MRLRHLFALKEKVLFSYEATLAVFLVASVKVQVSREVARHVLPLGTRDPRSQPFCYVPDGRCLRVILWKIPAHSFLRTLSCHALSRQISASAARKPSLTRSREAAGSSPMRSVSFERSRVVT